MDHVGFTGEREKKNSYVSVNVRGKFVRSVLKTGINCFMIPRDIGGGKLEQTKDGKRKM